MSARDCLKGKIALGRVSKDAGARILRMIDDAQKRASAGDETAMAAAMDQALRIATAEAAKKQAIASGSIVAQANVLRAQGFYQSRIGELRKTPGALGFGNQAPPGLGRDQSPLGAAVRSLLVRDPWEIATWDNVYYLGAALRKEAHIGFAKGIDYLRPKKLGLAPESAREEDVLGALFGREAAPEARATAQAFGEAAERSRKLFNEAAGYEAIPARKDWRIGNPRMESAKVQAWTPENFAREVAGLLDRDAMIDFSTGARMTDEKLAAILRDVHETGRLDGAEGQPNAGFVGEGPLSARRSAQRTLIFKDAESWLRYNELFGGGTGVLDAMMGHLSAMAHDTAIMRVLGPDPAATKRFILSMFDREAARIATTGEPGNAKSMTSAVVANRRAESSVNQGRSSFETYWAHMTGEAGIPVNAEVAKTMADVRHWLMASQLGTAILSSMADVGMLAAAARFNGLPATSVVTRMARMMFEKGSEITATQAGVVADTIAHGAGMTDRYMGEAIRTGFAAKMSSTVLRGIGLRRWSSIIRSAFGMEFQARMATHAEAATPWDALPFRQSLERYGVDEAAWSAAAQAFRDGAAWEPRPGAKFLRPMDLKASGDAGLTRTGDSLARMLLTEIDYTAIESDPLAKAIMMGRRPAGSLAGEVTRSGLMYRSYPVTMLLTVGARSFARGWNGERLAHGAFAFVLMTLLGAVSMQMKEITAGRDPLNLDASTPGGRMAWLKAMAQGGGFGVFGDMVFADKTRFGDTWAATFGGPFVDMGERILGQWLLRNIQLGLKGKDTHFFGDAVHIASRYVPGSNVWYWRSAFNRAVVQQLELLVDERAPERFRRIEEVARNEFGQGYWHRPGEVMPSRAPNFGAMWGAR